jgi:hypothetical protein
MDFDNKYPCPNCRWPRGRYDTICLHCYDKRDPEEFVNPWLRDWRWQIAVGILLLLLALDLATGGYLFSLLQERSP